MSQEEDDWLANESEEYRAWVEAGEPEPTAAEPVDGGECCYEDCDNEADYRVQWERRTTVLMCGSCSTRNRVYVVENGLLDFDIVDEPDHD